MLFLCLIYYNKLYTYLHYLPYHLINRSLTITPLITLPLLSLYFSMSFDFATRINCLILDIIFIQQNLFIYDFTYNVINFTIKAIPFLFIKLSRKTHKIKFRRSTWMFECKVLCFTKILNLFFCLKYIFIIHVNLVYCKQIIEKYFLFILNQFGRLIHIRTCFHTQIATHIHIYAL